jgi:hypothetical protein
MPKVIDMRGRRSGQLTVLERAPHTCKKVLWVARCDCGSVRVIQGVDVRSQRLKSCGCMKAERMRQTMTKHGHAGRSGHSAIYGTWEKMRQRCRNPNNRFFAKYGGRGIDMCDEWYESFAAFYQDMGDKPSPRHSLGRIDNDGPYSRGNCRWETPLQQTSNRRVTITVEWSGERMTLAEAARRCGQTYALAFDRHVRDGWPLERALTEPKAARYATG